MKYPQINPNVIISKQSEIAIDITTGKHISLPSGAYPILELIDGKTDMDSIIDIIMNSYKTTRNCVENFITNMSSLGFLVLSSSPQKLVRANKQPIRVASIEITEKCNLKCRYCYGAFAPTKSNYLSREEAARLFAELVGRNVKTIELTGGEPSVNPDFDYILSDACERFGMVTIMTNAVLLRSSTLEIYKKYKDKIGFSISIDGFSEKTNSYQRGVCNTFKKTLDNIIRIKEVLNPKFLRIVYMLTNENADEADDFFEYMISHNILDLMVSVPENIDKGRTYKLSDGCLMSDRRSQSRIVLEEKIIQIGEKFGKRIHTIADRLGESGLNIANAIPSCGAGWTMLSFQANGNVQPCNMMEPEWNLGNYKVDPKLDFLSFSNPLYYAFSNINLSADNGNRNECKECFHNDFCGKCVNKVFLANKQRVSEGKGLCPVLKKMNFSETMFKKKINI